MDRRSLEFNWLIGSSGSSKLLHRRKSIEPAKIRDNPDFEGQSGDGVKAIISPDVPNMVCIRSFTVNFITLFVMVVTSGGCSAMVFSSGLIVLQ
jgi:hypothetical protein